jgi:putative transcriptional regulator
VNLDHIDKICEVVGCDLTDILKYEPNKKKTD